MGKADKYRRWTRLDTEDSACPPYEGARCGVNVRVSDAMGLVGAEAGRGRGIGSSHMRYGICGLGLMYGFHADGFEGRLEGSCCNGWNPGKVALEAFRALIPPFFARGGGGNPCGGGGLGELDLRTRSSNSSAATRLGEIIKFREGGLSIVSSCVCS